ncbi:hypothetical protein AC578_3246 [Pseudocercospora eumusae]|uniref:Uncharacterized protein n=1 Tax=Pseudocercospora eumusae TaxID=321146 RepID=A0A139H252_9PEZI|nr:hypothetical protein AC578_3246 [Pseudocercospora eumusae]
MPAAVFRYVFGINVAPETVCQATKLAATSRFFFVTLDTTFSPTIQAIQRRCPPQRRIRHKTKIGQHPPARWKMAFVQTPLRHLPAAKEEVAVEEGVAFPSLPAQLPARSYANATKTATKQDQLRAGAGAPTQSGHCLLIATSTLPRATLTLSAATSPGHSQGIPQYQNRQPQYQSQSYLAPGPYSSQYGQQPAGMNRGYSGMQATETGRRQLGRDGPLQVARGGHQSL